MPRREAFDADTGDDAMILPDRYNHDFEEYHDEEAVEDTDLVELERRLNEDVDEDFFEEPRKFHTLNRVIDVLGLQMMDDATHQTETTDITRNPAYLALQEQQQVVEGAIEHMAVIHCADLNGSVIQVGRVARQFSEAVGKVRTLRKQVRDIQETLGASAGQANPNEASQQSQSQSQQPKQTRTQNAAAMSLRELWLKKLECEATLALLAKLDVIRGASAKFDKLVQPPCRIGAAVLCLSQALQTMFSDDVAQVQALHKIMEQLMLRKQKAEELIWDTLADVVYLRTGNGLQQEKAEGGSIKNAVSSGQSVSSRSGRVSFSRRASGGATYHHSSGGIVNPFAGRFAVADQQDWEEESVDSTGSGASLFSLEDVDDVESVSGAVQKPKSSASSVGSYESSSNLMHNSIRRMMIPIPMVEAELDLEADERRCLEEIALSGMTLTAASGSLRQRQLPRYADPVLALRILVECLAQMKRLDDVERIIGEGLDREIRQIVQREQARTFARLEKKRVPQSIRSLGRTENLKDFRRHLTGLMSAFGCVMIRLSHLAEILRIRISSDRELLQKMESPSSVMRPVITAAHEIMQREIKEFLKACLSESEPNRNDVMNNAVQKGSTTHESGLFSLGIVESSDKDKQPTSTATRSNVMEMTATKFVSTVLFPKTKSSPQPRHALTFRRSVARWTTEIEALKKELATLTNEDTSSPSYNTSTDESAIEFLDRVIQKELLPVLQEEAVNGTVQGLELNEAFDPVLDRTLFARPDTNEPQDVDMCIACQKMYKFTNPLFVALHRLPRGGEMYMPLVAVLEHVMLTFISRVKQQVEKICNGKTAFAILSVEKNKIVFSSVMERRSPFSLLLRAYSDGDMLEASPSSDDIGKQGGMMPLTPPASDTAPRQVSGDLKSDAPVEDVADGVEGEELVLDSELAFLEPYVDFGGESSKVSSIVVCTDQELMKASCLAHSLLKLASLLESRLRIRGSSGFNKTLTSTRTLREAIKTIKANGIKMAKFCRMDMLMQTIVRLSKICKSSTIAARDAVRIPSSVNDLGEYLTGASDNLREASGNAVTAYTFSSLEQYIPLCLMQTVRALAAGKGIITKAPLTMNGIEALDRSGSVLYRDLKGATSFDNSFWDVELAAVSFERSASFMAMLELDMEELVAYYVSNSEDFSDEDFQLIFSMNGPRRKGDIGRYHMMKRR